MNGSPQATAVKVGVGILATTGLILLGRKIINKMGKPPGRDLVVSTKTDLDKILSLNASLPPELRKLPSYSPSQMKTYADGIERAMKGPGTNETVINYAFSQMKNDVDLMLLVEAFGVRDDDNLTQWLEDDGMVENVNKILQTKAGVTYRF